MSFEYWYLFPISIVIATIAMASGIGGAVFFSPIFILALKLEPNVAIGTALVTELFGFSSGAVAYIRSRRIDYGLAGNLLLFSIPGAVAGVVLGKHFSPAVLKGVFASGLLFIARGRGAAYTVYGPAYIPNLKSGNWNDRVSSFEIWRTGDAYAPALSGREVMKPRPPSPSKKKKEYTGGGKWN